MNLFLIGQLICRREDAQLIPWRVSGQHELAAAEVWCLTPNLTWAANRIDLILDRVKRHPDRSFHYIVFRNEAKYPDPLDPAQVIENSEAALRNAEYILDKVSKDLAATDHSRLQIMFLYKDTTRSLVLSAGVRALEVTTPNDWQYLPIPTDIAIYVRTPINPRRVSALTTFGVMSLSPVPSRIYYLAQARGIHPSDLNLEESRGLDVVLRKEEHYKPIQCWLKRTWSRQ